MSKASASGSRSIPFLVLMLLSACSGQAYVSSHDSGPPEHPKEFANGLPAPMEASGPHWTNLATQHGVVLPFGWSYLGPLQNIYIFSNATWKLTAYLIREPATGYLQPDADAHLAQVRQAVAAIDTVGDWKLLPNGNVWVAKARSIPEQWDETYYVIRRPYGFWRLVYINKGGVPLLNTPSPDLITALLQSTDTGP